MRSARLAWPALLAALALAILAMALQTSSLAARPDLASKPGLSAGLAPAAADPPNCRYGAVAYGRQLNLLADLRIGWYLDFNVHQPAANVAAEFVQTVRITQTKEGCTYLDGYNVKPPLTETGLGAAVRANPGNLWIIGNEPDRGPNPGECSPRIQDDTYPQVYARAYHEVYHFIKERDPSAQVAIAGLVQVTPGRLQYLDLVWDTYRRLYGADMPVDVWTMHVYILPEAREDGTANGIANIALGTDPALAIRESGNNVQRCPERGVYCWAEHDSLEIFREQVVAMRTWMKARGQQDKPLLLSEYSLLYPFDDYDDPINPTRCFIMDEYGRCFTAARVSRYLSETLAYLETAADPNLGYARDGYRLVQRWLWWSMYSPDLGDISNLLAADQVSLSQVGQVYRDAVRSRPNYVNLFPSAVTHRVIPAAGGSMTATLTVKVRNAGNVAATSPFSITVYADAALTQVIGSATVPAPLGGCEQRTATVVIVWPGLTTGVHHYWVQVDSAGAVAESNEEDNTVGGVINLYERSLLLPLIWRR